MSARSFHFTLLAVFASCAVISVHGSNSRSRSRSTSMSVSSLGRVALLNQACQEAVLAHSEANASHQIVALKECLGFISNTTKKMRQLRQQSKEAYKHYIDTLVTADSVVENFKIKQGDWQQKFREFAATHVNDSNRLVASVEETATVKKTPPDAISVSPLPVPRNGGSTANPTPEGSTANASSISTPSLLNASAASTSNQGLRGTKTPAVSSTASSAAPANGAKAAESSPKSEHPISPVQTAADANKVDDSAKTSTSSSKASGRARKQKHDTDTRTFLAPEEPPEIHDDEEQVSQPEVEEEDAVPASRLIPPEFSDAPPLLEDGPGEEVGDSMSALVETDSSAVGESAKRNSAVTDPPAQKEAEAFVEEVDDAEEAADEPVHGGRASSATATSASVDAGAGDSAMAPSDPETY